MLCPKCGSTNTCVKDVLHADGGNTYRLRRCNDCNARFQTVETIISANDPKYKYEYYEAYVKRHPKKKSTKTKDTIMEEV